MSRHMLVADANLDQTNLEETLLIDTSLSGNRSVQEQGEDRDVSALTALSAESIAEEEEETFMDATVNGLDETEKFAELEAQLMKQTSEKKTAEAKESDDVLVNVDKTEIEDGNTSSLYRTASEVDTTMDGTLEERIQQLEEELIKEKEQKERAAQMFTEKSAEMAVLEEEMAEMNSSLTATQQNSQQVGELEMHLQLLENELGRVAGEQERAVALLQEKSSEVTALETQINELNATASTVQDTRRHMHELEVHIQLLDGELARQKGEKENANALLQQKSEELAALEIRISELSEVALAAEENNRQIEELKAQVQNLEAEFARQAEEKESAAAFLQQKSVEVSTLEARISELTAAASVAQESSLKQIEGLGTRIQMLESELGRNAEEKESANALLQEKSEEMQALERKISELTSMASTAENSNKQIEEFKTQMQMYEAELSRQAEEKESAAALLKEKSEEVTTLQGQMNNLTAATSFAQEDSQKQIEGFEAHIQMLESELAIQGKERESAAALLQEKSEEMQALEHKISELTAMASAAEDNNKQIEEFKAQMQMYEAELSRHAEEKESANVVLHQKSEEIATLEARINELTEVSSVAEDSNRQIEEFKVQMQLYEAELSRQAEEKESAAVLLKEKSEEMQALEHKISELTAMASAAEDSNKQIEEFKAQMQMYEAELARHADEKESAAALLKEKSDKVTALEIQINDLTVAASVIQENSQKQIEGLGTRIQMLESELAIQGKERESAAALLQEKSEEMQALERKISELTAMASTAENSNKQIEEFKAQMQMYEAELSRQAEEKESVAVLLKEKSDKATALEIQINDLTVAASVAQENRQKQVEGFETRIQMLESELARQAVENEGGNALLQEKTEEIKALEHKISELTAMASAAEDSNRQIEEFKVQMQLYEAELARHADEKESAAALLKEKSEEVTTLQGQMNNLTAATSVAQENSQKQIEGLGTRIQMLESELTRQAVEKESVNALLNERSTRVAALEAEMEKMSSAVAASQQDGLQREALESRIQLLEAELEKEREKSRQSVAKMEETLDEVDEIEERLTSEAVRWKRLYMELKKGVDKENAMMQAAVSGVSHLSPAQKQALAVKAEKVRSVNLQRQEEANRSRDAMSANSSLLNTSSAVNRSTHTSTSQENDLKQPLSTALSISANSTLLGAANLASNTSTHSPAWGADNEKQTQQQGQQAALNESVNQNQTMRATPTRNRGRQTGGGNESMANQSACRQQ